MSKKKKTEKFTLPDPDPEAFDLAVLAYRLAFQHYVRVYEAWEARRKEWEKLDEFDDVLIARDNATFTAEELKKEARDVLLAATLRTKPHGRDPFNTESVYPESKDPEFRAALEVLDRARALVEERKTWE